MTGKKKILKGGIIGFIPNQPKYNIYSVKNETINELFEKLTRNQSIMNKLRNRQRFQHFLEILNFKLFKYTYDPNYENKQINSNISNITLFVLYYNYFYEIYNKYKDTLIRDLQTVDRYKSKYSILLDNAITYLNFYKQKFLEEGKIKENFMFKKDDDKTGIGILSVQKGNTFSNIYKTDYPRSIPR